MFLWNRNHLNESGSYRETEEKVSQAPGAPQDLLAPQDQDSDL